ncbi:class II fructose-bisphosphate aldolase, partial [Enterococcus sp. DIV0170]|uniref:class II fructose-bisphosphate aldolase n=1 Tax=Enterococcus sp. DIV0170 TaxID=2774642 RepID=UPI003F274560
ITDVPLVLHGGSSSGNTNLNRCALNGIAKINIFTDFLNAAYKKNMDSKPKDYLEMKWLSNEAMAETLESCYKVFATKNAK